MKRIEQFGTIYAIKRYIVLAVACCKDVRSVVPTEMTPGPLAAGGMDHPSEPVAACQKLARPVRVLFLNTRDECGADVAVHLSLIRAFDRTRTIPIVIGNSQADDARAMDALYSKISDLNYRLIPLGLPAQRLARLGKAGKFRAMAPLAKSLVSALTTIRREKIDIIHATDRPRDASFAALLARLAGKPSVVHMHSNCDEHLSRATLWGFKNATALFAVSEYTKKSLVLLGIDASKIFVIHNSTDAEEFAPSRFVKFRESMRDKWGIKKTATAVGIVARLIPWKGHRELIDAIAQLLPDFPELALMIIGEGGDREALAQYAKERAVLSRIVFTGWQDDIRPLLASLDIFALPSYEEPFGLAITEAMAMGLPVIACASGGVPEIISDGENGLLVEPRSAEDLAAALRRLLTDAALCRKLGANARSTIEQQFHPRRPASLAGDIYAELIIHRRRRY